MKFIEKFNQTVEQFAGKIGTIIYGFFRTGKNLLVLFIIFLLLLQVISMCNRGYKTEFQAECEKYGQEYLPNWSKCDVIKVINGNTVVISPSEDSDATIHTEKRIQLKRLSVAAYSKDKKTKKGKKAKEYLEKLLKKNDNIVYINFSDPRLTSEEYYNGSIYLAQPDELTIRRNKNVDYEFFKNYDVGAHLVQAHLATVVKERGYGDPYDQYYLQWEEEVTAQENPENTQEENGFMENTME